MEVGSDHGEDSEGGALGFSLGTEVDVMAVDDSNWALLREISYDGKLERFTAPAGMGTDFASVPRVFVWFLPRYGRYTKAAILHDYLWRDAVPEGRLTLPEADGVFRRAMRELGVPFLRRWMMWSAVRLGALKKPGGTRHWLRDSWRVFPLLLLALPIVIPPALLILVSLVIFYVLELLFYLPLKVVTGFRSRRIAPGATSPKQVNLPTFRWKSA